ncbi:MAG: thioredoxin domain-containing protein [Myxococcota bacterium]
MTIQTTRATALLVAMAVFASACTTTKTSEKADAQGPQCTSPEVQNVLTYCVSPAAANYAKELDAQRVAFTAASEDPGASMSVELQPLPVGDSYVQGPDDASVTIVMFSDLECPFCSRAHVDMEALRASYPDDVRLVFKHFPLTQIHPNARGAAVAAMAAGAQGKFWEFVEAAFHQQDRLGPELYAEIMAGLGGDLEAFEKALRDDALAKTIAADIELGDAIQVQGTPTIYLNGVQLPPGVSPEQLGEVVEQQREIVAAFKRAGVAEDEIYWRMVRAQYQPPVAPPEQSGDEETPGVVYIPLGDSPARGASLDDALVTIVAFSDFECPFCSRANPAIDEALRTHSDKIRLVFKHFPLPFHKRADEAAKLSIIAASQDKFWAVHDLLFANQDALADADLQRYADEAGLGIPDITQAMQDPALLQRIEDDMTLGVQSGVQGTPTFFINGQRFSGVLEPDMLEALIEEQTALARTVQAQRGDVRGEALYQALVEANRNSE